MLNYSCSNSDKKLNKKDIPFEQFDQITKVISKKIKIKKELIFDLSFVSKQQIKKINKKYRKVNKTTDVISFALWDATKTIQSSLLGEIFICFDIAKIQAKQNKWEVKKELCFLFVHGILHLFQYDHLTKEDYDKMIKLQNNILKEIKF